MDLSNVDDVHSAMTGHLPIIREAIGQLGIYRKITEELPHDPRSRVSHADCVVVMILNILFGRVALYRMNEWLVGKDVDVVLGEGLEAEWFTDDRLASALDKIYYYGPDDLLSEVVRGYLHGSSAPTTYRVHTDTTTLKLYGAYERWLTPGEPNPANGHSKDHRPDLKQLVYGLNLHGSVGMPLCVSMLDGNASDHEANRLHIDQLAGLLPPQHEVTLVADCKYFDPKTLGLTFDADFHFITLVPRTYNLRRDLVSMAQRSGVEMPELVRERGRTAKDTDRVYRGVSYTMPFTIEDPERGNRKVDLQFLVVHSSKLAERFEAALPGKLEKKRKAYEKALRALGKRKFNCEPDAAAALDEFRKKKAKTSLHTVQFEIVSEVVPIRRKRRGRPRAGEPQPTKTIWRIAHRDMAVDEEAVEDARIQGSHFVLATDHLDRTVWNDGRILHEYRHQSTIEGHCGFRWLKGPAAAAPMFLKTPRRIAALGMVFVLALMVRNYVQYTIRNGLAERDLTLPNMNKQPTKKPTTENVFTYFCNVSVVLLYQDGRVVGRRLTELSHAARLALDLLAMDPSIFTTPKRPERNSRSALRISQE